MSDTQFNDISIDSHGRVAVADVLEALKDLRHEVQTSLNQIKASRIKATKHKLHSSKTSQRTRGTHLKLVTNNTGREYNIGEFSPNMNDSHGRVEDNSFSRMGLHPPMKNSSTDFPKNERKSDESTPKPLPEIEELHDIISLLDKLEK